MISRRNFLLGSVFAGGFKSSKNLFANQNSLQPVKLGNTDISLTPIGFGSSSSADPDLVKHAYYRGIRYFDTAESYYGGDSEIAIGEALQSFKRRDLVIASKTKAWPNSKFKDFMHSLEGSLTRLQTDYLDIYFNHAVNSFSRLTNDEWWEFIHKAKKDGKIRYSGISGHGGNLADCIEYSVDNNLVDIILSAFSFAQDPSFLEELRHTFHFVAINPRLPEVLKKAKNKGIGIIAMKTLAGARLNDMRNYEVKGLTFAQSAISWTLESGYADAAIISMTSKSLIDELAVTPILHTNREKFNLLKQYYFLNSKTICPPGCGDCKNSCPENVAINDILRSRMYSVDYEEQEKARESYAQIYNNANACLTCVDKPCLSSCGYGLDIKSLNTETHKRLI